MKNLYTVFAILLLTFSTLHADIPRIISYQGVLIGADGKPQSGMKNLEITIVSPSGTPHPSGFKHTESFILQGGLFYARLGKPPESNMDFPILEGDWNLKITEIGTSNSYQVALFSSPYALNIADNVVTSSKIVNNAIVESKIAPNSVNSSAIQDGAIVESKLTPNSVNSSAIQDGAIQSNHIAQGAITEFALADNSVANRHLQQECVTFDKIQFQTIGGFNVSTGAIGSRELSDYIDLTGLTMRLDASSSNKTHVYLGDLYSASGANQGQYQGYGFAIFGKDGVDPGWNTNQSVCGFRTDGAVYGTSKPFIVPDPTDPSRRIQYTAIEGPEAAMYVRGTGKLVNGKAEIKLPSHFKAMAVDTGMTVHLTPNSASSLGLALTNVSPTSFTVEEMQSGNGTYYFSYIVYAVRKGYENYKVYLYQSDALGSAPIENQNVKINPTTIKK